MKLAKLLDADRILLEMSAVGHWPAIVELLGKLVANTGFNPEQHGTLLEAFRLREEQVSTGIGSGVAIPHAFSDEIDEVAAVFGRSRVGIDFEALDSAPVFFIILFVVPRRDYHLHLRTLAAIAKIFTNKELLKCLAAAQTCEDVLAIFDPKGPRLIA